MALSALPESLETHQTNSSIVAEQRETRQRNSSTSFNDKITPPIASILKAKSLHRVNNSKDINDLNVYDSNDSMKIYLENLLNCCKSEEGFDIYQLVAFRRLNKESVKRTPNKPLALLGSEWTIQMHSPYIDALITAIIIGLLQIVGITLILDVTVSNYFKDADLYGISGCEYGIDAWRNDWMFKILAMLFAAMISTQLTKTITDVRHRGFNEALSSIDPEDFGKLYFVDIIMIQIGTLINVYTLFCAVLGSFFLIYASEAGTEALDMVLNSIALFFMVELDDYVVKPKDYEDVEDYIKELYKEKEDKINVQRCSERGLLLCKRIVNIIQFILVSLTYICGIIAPFLIAVCW